MVCIKIIKDEDFNIKSKKIDNPKQRIASRGIVIREDGKIAIINKVKKNDSY